MRTFQILTITLAIMFVSAAGVWASSGKYVDRDGQTHSWSIDDTHALNWAGKPYVPFGVMFEPRSLASEPTEETWAADADDVAAFKLAGVSDVYLRPRAGISALPIEAFQRIIDLLEANDLRYGIELYDPPYPSLSGFVVNPGENREPGIKSPGAVARAFPGAEGALYALCDARTAEIRLLNYAPVENDRVTAHVSVQGGDNVLLFYPLTTVEVDNGGLPDIWSDYDRYRDRLLLNLQQIEFGKGLRFMVDPFTERIGIHGDVEHLIPVSRAFRAEYAAWLSRKYNSPLDLDTSWGIIRHDIVSYDEAARLIPLWNTGKGTPAVYDEAIGRTHSVDATRSAIWADFTEFRNHSIRSYMDAMADVLKRAIADVPIVYTASDLHTIFRAEGSVGYDGLMVPDSGSRDALVQNAGQVYSLATASSRKVWMISRLRPTGESFANKEALFSTINTLRDLGTKGFFGHSPDGTAVSSADLMLWMAEYSGISARDTHFAAYRPRVVYYPEGFTENAVRRLPSGIWWLPSLLPGGQLDLGTSYAGYFLYDPKSLGAMGFLPDIYVWSTKGQGKMTLVTTAPVKYVTVAGDEVEAQPRRDRVELPVSNEPIIVRGISPDLFLPVETVTEALEDFEKAIAIAERRKLDVSEYRQHLKDARNMLNNNRLGLCYSLVRMTIAEIEQLLDAVNLQSAEGGRSSGTGS